MAQSSIVANGYDVRVPVTFNGYNGTVPIWLLTYDNFGGYAGWTQVGTRTVGSGGNFTLSTPPAQTLSDGQNVSVAETITPQNGFNSAVTFNWMNQSSWPAGLTGTFAQNPATNSTTITVSAAPSTPSGTYTLALSGSGGGVTQSTSFAVNVLAAQNLEDSRFVGLDTGEIYAWFSLSFSGEGAPFWTFQVQNATVRGPNSAILWGPASGPVQSGSTASIVQFPSFQLSNTGFGTYTQQSDMVFQGGGTFYRDSLGTAQPFPLPSIQSLTNTSGLRGTMVPLTINGTGLGTPDLDLLNYRGVTSVNVSGSGITTSFSTAAAPDLAGGIPPTASTLDANLTIAANAMPGTYYVSATVFGYTTNALQFAVADVTPYIEHVEQTGPLQAGQQGYIEIYGSNFGPVPGNVAVCPEGANPCSSSDVVPVAYTYWSDTQVNVQLSAGPNAPGGFYDVQLISAGATGTGFLQSPNGHNSSQSNRKPIAVNSQPNFTLQVTSNGNALNQNQCALIDPTPQMPSVMASIVSTNGSPITGTATWQIVTTFNQTTRTPIGGGQYTDPFSVTRTQSTPTNPDQRPADQSWTAPFQAVFGGLASLKWTYNGAMQTPFNFKICGQNPDFGTATSALNATGFWFAPNIAIHETNMSQFCEPGRLASTQFCLSSANSFMPALGAPAGYGMMQLDPILPTDPVDPIWNWRTNIATAQSKIQALAGPPVDTSATMPTDRRAYPFWIRQVRQWQEFNAAQSAQGQIPPPADQQETASCTFTLSPDVGTYSTPNTGRLNTYWFGDAVLLKQYNGAPVNYISWVNRNRSTIPRWSFNKPNLVSPNTVYEVCTCTTPGDNSCVHHLP